MCLPYLSPILYLKLHTTPWWVWLAHTLILQSHLSPEVGVASRRDIQTVQRRPPCTHNPTEEENMATFPLGNDFTSSLRAVERQERPLVDTEWLDAWLIVCLFKHVK